MGILSAILFASALSGNVMYAQPSRMYRTVKPGATVTETVRVLGAPANAVVGTMPFLIAPDGTPAHRSSGDRDLRPWMQIDSNGSEITVRVNVPESAKGTYWAAVMVETVSDLDPLRVRIRLAIPVIITVEGTARARCALANVVATPQGDELLITARIENIGDVGVNEPVLFAIEKDGVEVAAVDSERVLLLPGGARLVTARVPRVEGTEVVAMYRFGPGSDQVVLLRGLICHTPVCGRPQPRVAG